MAGANRYSAFIKLVANGKAIGTSFTAATELMSSEKVIAGGVYRIIVSARDAKNYEIGYGELRFTVPSDLKEGSIPHGTNQSKGGARHRICTDKF